MPMPALPDKMFSLLITMIAAFFRCHDYAAFFRRYDARFRVFAACRHTLMPRLRRATIFHISLCLCRATLPFDMPR